MDRPLILNQLGAAVGHAVSAHASRPEVIELPPGALPWSVPEQDGRIARAEILLTGPHPSWTDVGGTVPTHWPRSLRWIQSASVGVDWAPRWMLAQRSVVTCGRGHNSVPVAEYAMAALLDQARGLDRLTVRSRAAWDAAATRITSPTGAATLAGSTLGIAGYGSIGTAIAARAQAFGMSVRAWRRRPWADGEADANGVVAIDNFTALAASVDHLVLALPLTVATRYIVDQALLGAVRPHLHLVNIARGGLVDHDALLDALDAGRLGFATLDVTEPEPLPPGHRLFDHPRVRLTPHAAWTGQPDRTRLVRQIHRNLDHFLDGTTLHDVVDPEQGY